MLVSCGEFTYPTITYGYAIFAAPGVPPLYRGELTHPSGTVLTDVEGPSQDGVKSMLEEAAERLVITTSPVRFTETFDYDPKIEETALRWRRHLKDNAGVVVGPTAFDHYRQGLYRAKARKQNEGT